MNEQQPTIEELTKKIADMEASHKKSIADITAAFQAYKLETNDRITHLEVKNTPTQRPGVTRSVFQ